MREPSEPADISEMQQTKASSQGLMTVVGCCIVLSCIGGGQTLVGITIPSICAELNIATGQAGLYVLLSTFTAFVSGLVGTKFLAFLTPRWSMLLGVLAETAFLVIAGTAQSLPVLVSAGFFGGIALSCTFPPIASLMSLHFKENSGKWFGLTTGTQVFLVAGLIKIAGFLLKTHEYRFVILVFAAINIVVGTLLCFLLIRQPKRSVMRAKMREAAAKKAADEAAHAQETENGKVANGFYQGFTVKEALGKPSLYLFGIGLIAGAIITGSMTTYGSSFFVLFGMTQAEAADMMSMYTLFCGVHVLWTGFFQARFGSRAFIIVQYAAILVGVLLLVLWASNQSFIFVVLGLLLVSFIKPINSTPALLLPDLFGRKNYLAFNSLSNGIYYAGVCISSQSTAAILTALGGSRAFVYLGIMAVIALVVFNAALSLSPIKKMRKANSYLPEQ